MTIILTIDSVDSLPDGGPIQFRAQNRNFEIGRQPHLDWTLPDPSRYISGVHCDVRFEKGGYWLYDVSRNGTFLNGSQSRMKSPYLLADGDRLTIGPYIVTVQLLAAADLPAADDGYQPAPVPSFAPPSGGGGDIWDTGEPAPPPIDRRELMPERPGRRAPDFGAQFIGLPDLVPAAPPPPSAGPAAAGIDPFADPAPAARMPSSSPAPAFGPGPGFAPEADPFALPGHGVRSRPVPDPAQGSRPVPDPAPIPPFPAPAGTPGAMPDFGAPPAQAFQAQPVPRPRTPPPAPEEESFGVAPRPRAAPLPPMPAAPMPMPQAAPPPPQDYRAQAAQRFLEGLAAGAGVTPDMFMARDPGEIGFEVGEVLRVTVEQVAGLLRARAAAKAMTKSSSRTMIGATDNNPLKFIPGAAEAIDVMFTRRRPGFLGAKASLEAGFGDLRRHEMATFSAMQKALSRLIDDLSPEAISNKVGNSVLSSRKSRSWDLFVERWEAKTEPFENGMLDVFLAYFAEAYDEASKKG